MMMQSNEDIEYICRRMVEPAPVTSRMMKTCAAHGMVTRKTYTNNIPPNNTIDIVEYKQNDEFLMMIQKYYKKNTDDYPYERRLNGLLMGGYIIIGYIKDTCTIQSITYSYGIVLNIESCGKPLLISVLHNDKCLGQIYWGPNESYIMLYNPIVEDFISMFEWQHTATYTDNDKISKIMINMSSAYITKLCDCMRARIKRAFGKLAIY